MSVRRMAPFILINILVSASVVLAILFWWDNRRIESSEIEPISVVPRSVPTEESEVTFPVQAQPQQPSLDSQDERLTYVVQPGDNLGFISQKFDVLLVDLMEANGISDAHFVNAGETLIIPVERVATSTPSPTDTPGSGVIPSPIPTLPSEGEALVEITTVLSPGDINEERVTIVNSGERQINLGNWRLEDEQGHVYVFGSVILFGNGVELVVHTRVGQSGLLDQFWGLNDSIWQPGETVLLKDAEGTVRARTLVDDT